MDQKKKERNGISLKRALKTIVSSNCFSHIQLTLWSSFCGHLRHLVVTKPSYFSSFD